MRRNPEAGLGTSAWTQRRTQVRGPRVEVTPLLLLGLYIDGHKYRMLLELHWREEEEAVLAGLSPTCVPRLVSLFSSPSSSRKALGSLYIGSAPGYKSYSAGWLVAAPAGSRPTTSWQASGGQDPDDRGAVETSGA